MNKFKPIEMICSVFIIFYSGIAVAQDDTCDELLTNEQDLELLYNNSDMVFIARISPRKGPNGSIYNYTLFDPVLKGTVEKEGFVTFDDACSPRNDDAIYIFFLESIAEKISGYNAAFFSLPDGGPGFTWIAEWVETKVQGN